ncbi:SusC/RagA family TonB-linked outer membrane protein [Pedobacter fastidiosus]|uniref:SusC/RagA family TonB-linked outer membrane protein n=1 Tax=Pedobacter fastidiosus TaxID=2765361 RepID=A0ABR7KP73_9SPHI|nr:SusC/RagA family TonB-linked outer membrane protein [Pedobacter fastidiosus]MBC6109749.1 SusC/RagA family TonB-linked outer membrane protein [Pedobacter fastidiosus]
MQLKLLNVNAHVSCCNPSKSKTPVKRAFRVFKLSMFFLLLPWLAVYAQAQAQTVTLKMQNVSLQKVIKEISKQTKVSVVYNEAMFTGAKPVSVNVNQASISEVLDKCFADQPFSYEIQDGTFVIRRTDQKPEPKSVGKATFGFIQGVVKDDRKQPVEGVNVAIPSLKMATVTGKDGSYNFSRVPYGKHTLILSYIGFDKKQLDVDVSKSTVTANVSIKESDNTMEDVVVNGIFSRPKANFTGSATSFTGDQLREISPTSILTALKTLDASFQMPTDDINGSNPNVIPRVQLRGSNSIAQTDLQSEYGYISNPPLIIIDGFESTLQKVYDMDINRIAKITLLKDAAATAIYGSKSANGVMVIETKQPKPGELDIMYTANLTVNLPDLTSFNLMNAEEKLNYERIAGLYKDPNFVTQNRLTNLYNLKLRNIQNGVNTYWLSQPLHPEFNQAHSINLSAGTERFVYQLNVNYGKNGGIMKGSNRDNLAGNLNMKYKYKGLSFQYQFSLGSTTSNNSPYGDFSQYSKLNPYWTKTGQNGQISKYVDNYILNDINGNPVSLDGRVPTEINPLWNTTLNTVDNAKQLSMGHNVYAEYAITPEFKLNGTFTIQNSTGETNKFLPRAASQFFGPGNFSDKGSYDKTNSTDRSTQASFNINYGKVMGQHTVYATFGTNIQEGSGESLTIKTKGFASDRLDDISFALKYNGEKPDGSYQINRTVGFYGNTSYAFDNRYLLDGSFRIDGSSVFGADNRFGKLWSVGAAWNVHKEKLFKLPKVINQLKLRGSYGFTGSVNFDSFASTTTYKYNTSGQYLDFIPTSLIAAGNPDLKWQRTKKLNLGADLGLFNNRLMVNFNYYNEITDDLIMANPAAPSSGFSSFQNNLGKTKNTGYDISLSAFIIKNPDRQLFWNVSTSWYHNKNTLLEITDVLRNQNKVITDSLAKQTSSAPFLQYKEGSSISTLYAVRSLGIDPSNGYEIFLTKDGKQTYIWNVLDQVALGDLQPKFNITFNNHFQYKWLKLNFGLNVVLGGVKYNTTLADKLESADVNYNVDRRALDGRWQNPGDVADYKGLTTLDGYHRTDVQKVITSRFVRKNAAIELTGLSLDPGALLSKYITKFSNKVIEKVNSSMKNKVKSDMIDVKFYMNNAFSLFSQEKERGTSYPLNRTYAFNITLHL